MAAHRLRNALRGATQMALEVARLRSVLLLVALVLLAASGAGDATGAGYAHPMGFRFAYPDGWQIAADAESVVLVPDGVRRDAGGSPREIFVIAGDDAEGVRSPDDPRITAYFEGLARQHLANLTLDDGGAYATAMGPGRLLRFEGTSAAGLAVRFDTYVTLRDGVGVFLVHMSERSLAGARERQAREIFQSFAWGERLLDPALTGVWHASGGEYSAGTGGGPGFNSWERSSFALEADGSCVSTTERVSGVAGDGGSGIRESGGTERCSWAAADGELFVEYENGVEKVFAYRLFTDSGGRTSLELREPGKKPLHLRR